MPSKPTGDNSHKPARRLRDEDATEAGHEPLSLVTFLLCVAAAVGSASVLLHMLSQCFR